MYSRAGEKIDRNMRSWWNIRFERIWHVIFKFIRNSREKNIELRHPLQY